MGVLFHILSVGAGKGASRITRYIAEREKDLNREGPGSRPLFDETDRDLTYRGANWVLDPEGGRPEKSELIHFSVMIFEEEFDKLGEHEKDRQERFREVVREGMKGMAQELNVERLTWVAGIHHDSEHPHAHIVFNKNVREVGTGKPKRIARLPRNLLPSKDNHDGRDIIINGPLAERFAGALEKQQALYVEQARHLDAIKSERTEQIVRSNEQYRNESTMRFERASARGLPEYRDQSARDGSLLHFKKIVQSWNASSDHSYDPLAQMRMAAGRGLTLELKLAFAQAWHERAVKHGDTYRFEVVDQSIREERKISDLDVRRRAAARAERLSQGDPEKREKTLTSELGEHSDTLKDLALARQNKISSLEKDINSLRGNLDQLQQKLMNRGQPGAERLVPLLSRETLAGMQEQAVKLQLSDRVVQLENLRSQLASEYSAPARTDAESGVLLGQLNVSRADLNAKDERLLNFEASAHVTRYEIGDEQWSLADVDKQAARLKESSRFIPRNAMRLDLRALTRLNYSPAAREQAALELGHLELVRSEVVRRIEERRSELLKDTEQTRDVVAALERVFVSEMQRRRESGLAVPKATYDRSQVQSLEASAELLYDPELLKEVHAWEKASGDSLIDWRGRASAREITSQVSLEDQQQRLDRFLESEKVTSLYLGESRTATLREVEAHTLTNYLVRSLTETLEDRNFRNQVKLAARENHARLVNGVKRAERYHEAARELASESDHANPQFTDKEKMNLEIYAERQTNEQRRDDYLALARGEDVLENREISISRGR